MAKVTDKFFNWGPSTAADLATYKVYAARTGEGISYDTPAVEVGNVTRVYIGALANQGYEPLVNAEGEYDLGVSAVDNMGNESDIVILYAVPLDFVPPVAPVNPYVD